jgi:hypothetical protein
MLTQKVERGSVDRWHTVSSACEGGETASSGSSVSRRRFSARGPSGFCCRSLGGLTVILCRLSEEYILRIVSFPVQNIDCYLAFSLGTAVDFEI